MVPTVTARHVVKPEYSSLVPAVEQASRIMLALAQAESGKMTLTEICKTVGIHKSKGYSILNTLQHFAFVYRSPDKAYQLAPGLLFLSAKVLSNMDYREPVTPVLHRLSHQMNSTAFLGIISDGTPDRGGQGRGESKHWRDYPIGPQISFGLGRTWKSDYGFSFEE